MIIPNVTRVYRSELPDGRSCLFADLDIGVSGVIRYLKDEAIIEGYHVSIKSIDAAYDAYIKSEAGVDESVSFSLQ